MLRALTRRSLFTAVAAALAIVVFAAPASAHTVRIFLGKNYTSVGSDHRWVEVCDKEEDGNGVFASFYGANSHFLFDVGDANGSSGGCGNRTASENIVWFQMCERQFIGNACTRGQSVT
jgi:hypothetical protein